MSLIISLLPYKSSNRLDLIEALSELIFKKLPDLSLQAKPKTIYTFLTCDDTNINFDGNLITQINFIFENNKMCECLPEAEFKAFTTSEDTDSMSPTPAKMKNKRPDCFKIECREQKLGIKIANYIDPDQYYLNVIFNNSTHYLDYPIHSLLFYIFKTYEFDITIHKELSLKINYDCDMHEIYIMLTTTTFDQGVDFKILQNYTKCLEVLKSEKRLSDFNIKTKVT